VQASEVALNSQNREGSVAAQLQELRAAGSQVPQDVPVRAASVSVGQIAQNKFGGRAGILRRQRAATLATNRAQRASTQLEALVKSGVEQRGRLTRIRTGEEQFDDPADRDATLEDLEGKYGRNIAARKEQREVAKKRTAFATEKQGGVLSTPQQLRAQTTGLGGIIIGTTIFSTAMAAFSTAAQAAATVLSPLIQDMLGWPAAIDKVSASIRDNVRAAGGNVQAGAAAALAPSGVSAEYLDSQGRNITETGANRAAAEAGALAQDVTRASRAAPKGLYEGMGGLLGSNIGTELFGGQPGFLQTLTGRLGSNITKPMDLFDQADLEKPTEGFDQVDLERARGVSGSDRRKTGAMVAAEDAVALLANVEDLNTNLQNAAEYAGDAAGAFQLVTDATDAQKDAMIKSADAVGADAGARAREIAKLEVAVVGPDRRDLVGEDFEQFAKQARQGAIIEDPALLLRRNQNQRAATAFGIGTQGEFTRNEDIPSQRALQLNQAPLAQFGSTFSTEGLEKTVGGQKTLENIEKIQAQLLPLTEGINQDTADGLKIAGDKVSRIDTPTLAGGIPQVTDGRKGQERLVAGKAGPARTDFDNLTGQIGALGSGLQTQRDALSQREATHQATVYTEQIRLAEQALSDSNDLWASIKGASIDTVGGLEGQNILLGRQNQLISRRQQQLSFKSEDIGFKTSDLQIQSQNLGFEQTQRQINFSKASAGFTAPGTTPEERAARINEAKIEAEYAQKQLNLQIKIAAQGRAQLKLAKEIAGLARTAFANQNQQQDNDFKKTQLEAKRAIEAQQNALDQNKEGYAINIDEKALTAATEIVLAQMDKLSKRAESYVSQAGDIRSALVQDAQAAISASGKALGALIGDIEAAWNTTFGFISASYKTLTDPGTYTPGGSGGSGDEKKVNRASGGIDTVNSPTRFLAGEAGTEHVIVLRNAKQGMMMGTGGGGGSVVNVGGINLYVSGTKDMDEDKLADVIERKIVRKLQLLGA